MSTHQNIFHLEKSVLKWVGLALEPQNFLYRTYTFFVVIVIILMYPLILLIDLFTQDFNQAVDSWLTVIGYLMVLPGAFTSYLRRDKLLALFDKLTENYEHDLVQKWQRRKHIKTMVYFTFVVFTVVSQIVKSLTLRFTRANPNDWKLGFGTFSIINITYSPNFEIVYFYQSLAVLHGCIINVMNTIVIMGLLDYIATQLKILQNNLRDMVGNAQDQGGKAQAKDVKKLVEHHVRIMSIAKDFQEIYSWSTLIVFLAAISVTCIEIYRSSMLPLYDIVAIRMIFETVMAYFQMFLICTSSENMTKESENVAVAAYQVDFVGTSLDLQQSLVIIMRQAQKPLLFKAGNLVDISVITFTTILRTSYSAYAMLKNVNGSKL